MKNKLLPFFLLPIIPSATAQDEGEGANVHPDIYTFNKHTSTTKPFDTNTQNLIILFQGIAATLCLLFIGYLLFNWIKRILSNKPRKKITPRKKTS
jgi:hypothetical protein